MNLSNGSDKQISKRYSLAHTLMSVTMIIPFTIILMTCMWPSNSGSVLTMSHTSRRISLLYMMTYLAYLARKRRIFSIQDLRMSILSLMMFMDQGKANISLNLSSQTRNTMFTKEKCIPLQEYFRMLEASIMLCSLQG